MKKKLLSLALIVGMGLSLCACGGSSVKETPAATTVNAAEGNGAAKEEKEQAPIQASEGEKKSDKDTLIVGLDREPATLDPMGNNVVIKRMLDACMFDTLLKFDDDLKPMPWLAESWEQVDELTWKFNLRKDVKFHNGDPLTSKDVKFSFLRIHSSNLGNDSTDHFDPDGYETPDDYTFILKTLEPYAFTEAEICSPALSIVPEKVVTEMGDDAFGRAPVGSGPYKFVSWTTNDNITIERNDDYWEEKSNLKTLKFRIITEAASRTIDLESGGLDMTLALPVSDVDRIEENPNTQLILHNNAYVRYLAPNCQQEPFTDKRVRQALNYATDKETIRLVCYGEKTSEPMTSVVPDTLPGHTDSLEQYGYDIEKAKSLLKEAGYENGFEVEFMYMANSTNSMLAELLQQMWGQIGVTLVLKPMENAALATALNKGEQQLCCAGTNYPIFEAGSGLYNMFHSKNMYSGSARANLSSPEVDEILDKIVVESDAQKREELVVKAQELIHEESPFIYIAYTKSAIGASSKLRGFDPIPTAMYDFRSVYFVE